MSAVFIGIGAFFMLLGLVGVVFGLAPPVTKNSKECLAIGVCCLILGACILGATFIAREFAA